MTPRALGRLQGDDLIGEVLRNMEEGIFRIRGKSLVPSVYRIYLHPADYEPFRYVLPFIAGEIRTALDARLAKWNRTKRRFAQGILEKIGAGEVAAQTMGATEVVRASDSWLVEIYPDLDGKLQAGEIEVYSDLGAPQKAEYGAGSLTRRIFPKAADPKAADPEPAEPDDPAPTVATVRPEPASLPTAPLDALPPAPEDESEDTKPRAFAYIQYVDQQGSKTFEMTKNQMVIGRGGRSYWVDLKLETLPDVSREHCRIQRDAETGRFTIEDLSQFGTAVNGRPVGKSLPMELPRRGTISLAGVLDLKWESA
ncbi:MAG TPA: FHA domain-containing protein [Bryobacteraceae bacterium]|nr:FHA domain-containing protein [Bryobacteraceae bacterium]